MNLCVSWSRKFAFRAIVRRNDLPGGLSCKLARPEGPRNSRVPPVGGGTFVLPPPDPAVAVTAGRLYRARGRRVRIRSREPGRVSTSTTVVGVGEDHVRSRADERRKEGASEPLTGRLNGTEVRRAGYEARNRKRRDDRDFHRAKRSFTSNLNSAGTSERVCVRVYTRIKRLVIAIVVNGERLLTSTRKSLRARDTTTGDSDAEARRARLRGLPVLRLDRRPG